MSIFLYMSFYVFIFSIKSKEYLGLSKKKKKELWPNKVLFSFVFLKQESIEALG